MPQSKKLVWAQLRVGVMAIAAVAILMVLVFLISGKAGFFTKTVPARMYVDDSASLKVGAPVRLNGIDAGNVSSVRLSGQGGNRTVEIALKINRDFLSLIPSDSQGSINPEGVFGDKYINITRGQSTVPLKENGEIRSLDTKEFQEVVNESYNVLASLNAITNRIDSITQQVEQGKGTIGKLLYDETLYQRMDAVVREAQRVTNLVSSGQGTIGKLLANDEMYSQANATLRRVDDVVARVQSGGGTIGMLLNDPTLYQNVNRVAEQSQKVVENINAGRGTVGKLLKDEQFYNRLNTTLDKTGGTLDKAGALMERVNSGQGTIGQLLVNRALYDSATGMTVEMRELLRDIRANPKKFLRIKLGLF
jgi:phospholipid/cholesterol/gamma-HCH transport system substrate-binding protein